ncbi:MAG TPA: protein kinase, partial [Gemmata sp.]|nr:protein kinase [Gemmata sp.]
MPGSSSDPLHTADLHDVAKADATRTVSEHGTVVGSEPCIVASTESVPTAATTRYILGAEIARGGMGIIYQASDTRLDREVALKVLQNHLALHSATGRRFEDEARISAQLQHPAIPPIHDLGTLPDGRPFLAMKLIEGETLNAMLVARRSPDRDRGRFVAIFEQICQAIAYAHTHRVIHRDLKPANIMVGKFGEVQVMDWGLAKVVRNAESGTQNEDPHATTAGTEIRPIRDSDGMKTETGSVLGTPAFMPPEQAVGAIGQIDKRSDVFGLGAILAVILTGQPPFVSNTAETTRILAAQGKVEDCLARLDACGADPEFVALCKQCLAPLQKDRPCDATEVAKAVAELRSAADERAQQAELDRVRAEGERAKAQAEAHEQRKRRRVQMALAVALGLLLFGGGAFAMWQDRQAIAQRDRLARNAEAVTTLLAQAEEALKADDPDRAEIALQQAEKRFGDGGADNSKEGLDRLRADLVLLRNLDRIDNIRCTPVDTRYPGPTTLVPLWMEAFTSFGIVPGKTSGTEIAARLSESAIRERALTALDRWIIVDHSADVASVLRFADQDSFRTQIREAICTKNANGLIDLAQKNEALAQPVWFVALTSEKSVPLDRRRLLLERALAKHPGNLNLLIDLGSLYPVNVNEGVEDRIRWFQAAVSTHPQNIVARNSLGVALLDKGDPERAIACFEEAIRLDPKDV